VLINPNIRTRIHYFCHAYPHTRDNTYNNSHSNILSKGAILPTIPRCSMQQEVQETCREHIAPSRDTPKDVQITAYTSCFEEEYSYIGARVFRFKCYMFHVALLQKGKVMEHLNTCEFARNATCRAREGLTSRARDVTTFLGRNKNNEK
jgi:hypothetical protein